jgi:glycosyltransferase involved in cell wall biosynthesis
VTRVLLVCPEPLERGQPAGIGIRFLEMAKVLREDGHEITLLDRDAITPSSLATASANADVAVLQGHVANDFFAHARAIPAIVDLYDPFIIENLHYFATRGGEVFEHDHATLTLSLKRGDFFLCASEAQRHFYLGMLLAIGRLNPVVFESDPDLRSLIAIAPFGVQPARARTSPDLANPQILFGGIYDWYEPIVAIDAVALAREQFPGMTVTFSTHPNPEITPQGKAADAMRYAHEKRYESFVRFEPWVAYDRRGVFLDRFAAALLTFPQSLETDLSMRTRVYDYLWAGIPIVTSSAPGTDEIIAGAGIVVRTESARDYADALVRVLRDHARMTAGTAAFVESHQWRDTLAPLRSAVKRLAESGGKSAQSTTLIDRIRRRIGGTS